MSIDPAARPRKMTSDELLAAARAGSGEALGSLLETFRTYLLMTGLREMQPSLQVKVAPSDLVQQTFVEAQRSIASFEGDTAEQFTAWLRGILLHKLAHAHRFYVTTARRSLLREEPQAPRSSICEQAKQILDEETPSRAAVRSEEADLMHTALARIPEHYRQVIQLRNFDLLRFEDIGVLMGRPAGAVRALWVRAMQRLKEELHGLSSH